MFKGLLLQVDNPITLPPHSQELLNANPYNAIGYGIALLVLAYVAYVFYVNYRTARNDYKELSVQMIQYNKEVLQVLVKVEQRLNDQQAMVAGMSDIRSTIGVLLKQSEAMLASIQKHSQ